MFFNYSLKLRHKSFELEKSTEKQSNRINELEKKNGSEQAQINELKAKVEQLEKKTHDHEQK